MESKDVKDITIKDNIKLSKEKQRQEIKIIDSRISLKEKIYTIGITVILAIIYDVFFNGKEYGLSIVIFYIMFMCFFLWSIREKVLFEKNIGLNIIVPTLLLTLNYAIHSNNILNYFNAIMIVVLITLSTVLIRYDNIKWDSKMIILKSLNRVIKAIPENVLKPFIFVKRSINARNAEKRSMNRNILRGLIISIPLLIVILMLLTSADMVFKNYIINISSVFENIKVYKIISHLLVVIMVFFIIFSYIWSFKYNDEEEADIKKDILWEPVTVLTIIFMINIVYFLFSIVQFTYLYGGSNNFLPLKFTYSQYARKGFFELFIVTIINFTILLCSMKYIKTYNKVTNIISNVLLTLLVGFTVNMLFSAHFKMSLYEQIYGFTYLRIFVHIFMIMLFVLFIVALIGIWNRKMKLNKVLIVVVLIMYVLLNFVNVDKIIAGKNIDIYYKTQRIDVIYLETLSYDAIPEIVRLKNDPNIKLASEVNNYLKNVQKNLSQKRSWYEFNYSKFKARKSINK
ncbi:DUF4153 domain-containing protein [Clostridium estertheticum]|uniref:DUF4153 domain-containing protein n=1 Tax=Clostridium estertheticum TaxID=238834 RepID=UPI001C6EA313|nr:DUF4173 domain-containing protein [Clostridium estertheticum]MBW9151220.1 DUF4173 domain-containing protein [Clostridium estertheticum]WLC84794.1 DUF4173 domain-containing protein [Clostridium estertheticum]